MASLSYEKRLQIKICERCFLCHSIVLCKSCNKRQTCCNKSACRGSSSKLLANLAGNGCWSESGSNPERRLHPPLPDPTKTHKVSYCHKLLCQSSQEQLPVRGITSASEQKCYRTGSQPNIPRVFQSTIFSPQAQQQMETHLRPEQAELVPQARNFKMETPETIRTSLQQGEWVASIDLRDAYFHIPIQEQSRKYLRFHVKGRTYQFKALPFGLSTAPLEFTVVAKEVKLMAF